VVECIGLLKHFDTRMPEVPPQNEKNYLPARTGVGDASEIFSTRFARENDDIDPKGLCKNNSADFVGGQGPEVIMCGRRV
jgi:hypothetical protein